MKTISFGVSALAITVMVFVGLLQIVNVDTRASNLQDSLHAALSSSLDTALNERAYTIDDEDQLVADVVQGVILELNDPTVELKITVNKVDRVLGIISMKVTGTFQSVSGGKSTVSVERTVILEHVENPRLPDSYSIRFEDTDGTVIKTYWLMKNSQKLPYPMYRSLSGMIFEGWTRGATFYPNNAAGEAALGNLPLDRDYVFVARAEYQ